VKSLVVVGVLVFAIGIFFKFIDNTDDFNSLFKSGVSIKDLRNALLMSDRVRQSVNIYAVMAGVFPSSNDEAKVQKKEFYRNKYISEIEIIGSGNVVVRLDDENYDVSGAEIVFSPSLANSQVHWSCYHVNISDKPINIGGNMTCLPIAKLEKPTLVEQVGNWESEEDFSRRMHENVELKRKERELYMASIVGAEEQESCIDQIGKNLPYFVMVSGSKVFSLDEDFQPVDVQFIRGASHVGHAGELVYVYGNRKITELKLDRTGKFHEIKTYGSRPTGTMKVYDRFLLTLGQDMISVRDPCQMQVNNYSYRISLINSIASDFTFIEDVLVLFNNNWDQSSIFTYELSEGDEKFTMTGQILLPGGALNGAHGENYLWVNSGRAGISVVDIKNHSWKKQHLTKIPITALNVFGDTLIVGDASKNIVLYRISGVDIEQVGEFELPSVARHIAVVGNHLVISMEYNSTTIYRLDDDNKLTLVTFIDDSPAANFGF